MIKLLEQRLKGLLDVGKVHHPACLCVWLAADVDGNQKRVAMQAPAFVFCRHVGQSVVLQPDNCGFQRSRDAARQGAVRRQWP